MSSPTPQTRAVFAILLSVSALSLGDAVIKAQNLALPLWQMFILRSALALPVLGLLAHRRCALLPQNYFWVSLRCLFLFLMWISYYAALPVMPLSLAAAGFYAGPVMIVLMAHALQRQVPGVWTCVAALAGFCGVLMAIGPDANQIGLSSLLPILAAGFYASAMLITNLKCQTEDPVLLVLALNVAFVVGGGVLALWAGRDGSHLLGPWQMIDASLLATLALLSGLMIFGAFFAAIAYQIGQPSVIAALDYSYVIFSVLWGALFFAERPSLMAAFGIVLIIFAGVLAIYTTHAPEKAT